VLKNPHLAHFLLFDFKMQSRKEGILARNYILLNQRYIDEVMIGKPKEVENDFQVDLQNLLEVNQLMSKFDD